MKRRRTCSLIGIGILVLVVITSLFVAHAIYNSIISEPNALSQSTQFVITPNESLQEVGNALVTKHIISNAYFFDLYLKLNHSDTTVEAGTYLIPAHVTLRQVVTIIQKSQDANTIRIEEGLRLEEQAASIDDQLSQNNPAKEFSKDEFISLAKSPQQFHYPFITSQTTTLEGFLFPDTYQVDKSITAKDMINLMLQTFQMKAYSQFSNANTNGLAFYQNLILASILQREAKTQTDQRIIAGILLKRLATNYPLGVDSTIQYELGYSQQENTWWRQTIYQSDLENNNPYNTRLNPGLPPTPICNPGVAAIADATSPITTNYFYYLSDKNGIMHYADTIDEQNANIAKYLQ